MCYDTYGDKCAQQKHIIGSLACHGWRCFAARMPSNNCQVPFSSHMTLGKVCKMTSSGWGLKDRLQMLRWDAHIHQQWPFLK